MVWSREECISSTTCGEVDSEEHVEFNQCSQHEEHAIHHQTGVAHLQTKPTKHFITTGIPHKQIPSIHQETFGQSKN